MAALSDHLFILHAANARNGMAMDVRIRDLSNVRSLVDAEQTGSDMFEMVRDLFPICRSITGDGVRRSLAKLGEWLPLTTHEVATGTQVFDWTVPKEWNIRDAYIKDAAGRRVVDFRQNNLHVVNYSVPVSARMTLSELRPRLHTLPEHPDWIPYRTTYYAESWGFCLSERQLESLTEDEYEVVIDSTLEDGALTYGECVLPGQIEDEFLISVHICHPSLCNDNLSGVAVATALARILASTSHRYTYRFLFVPGTIGPIAWLFGNQDAADGSSMAWCLPASATGAASITSAVGASPPISIGRSSMSCGPKARPSRSAISRLTVTTNGNIARQASIFPWGAFGGPRMASIPSTIHRQTISSSCLPRILRIR